MSTLSLPMGTWRMCQRSLTGAELFKNNQQSARRRAARLLAFFLPEERFSDLREVCKSFVRIRLYSDWRGAAARICSAALSESVCRRSKSAMPSAASIVIPALNEAAVIGDVVGRLRACRGLQEVGISDIVVVDNGSDDGTGEVARFAGARVVQEPRRGYGRACLTGVQAVSHAEVVILMDGD